MVATGSANSLRLISVSSNSVDAGHKGRGNDLEGQFVGL
jgi:hypothetical protein